MSLTKKCILGCMLGVLMCAAVGCGNKTNTTADDKTMEDTVDETVKDTKDETEEFNNSVTAGEETDNKDGVIDNVGDTLEDVGEGVGEGIKDVGEGIGEGVEDLTGNGDRAHETNP